MYVDMFNMFCLNRLNFSVVTADTPFFHFLCLHGSKLRKFRSPLILYYLYFFYKDEFFTDNYTCINSLVFIKIVSEFLSVDTTLVYNM